MSVFSSINFLLYNVALNDNSDTKEHHSCEIRKIISNSKSKYNNKYFYNMRIAHNIGKKHRKYHYDGLLNYRDDPYDGTKPKNLNINANKLHLINKKYREDSYDEPNKYKVNPYDGEKYDNSNSKESHQLLCRSFKRKNLCLLKIDLAAQFLALEIIRIKKVKK